MAPLRVALDGFGRIGRNLFRILYKSDEIRIAAISDPADHSALEYLKPLSNLRTLRLRGTRVTEEGVRDLKQTLPDCSVSR